MIPQQFEYSAPKTLDEALGLLAEGAKPLAGGMSLIPMMKLRLASPEHLVDLGRIKDLSYIREQGTVIHIGATTTHHDVESSPLLRGKCPLLAETASHIGDVQVRNMGTIGGSVAHADPAADYPAALQALEAKIVLRGAKSERTVSADDFFVDTFTTALEPGEIVREVIVPVDGDGTGTSYQKVLQPASGFAIVGIAVRVRKQRWKGHDGSHRRHRTFEPGVPGDGGGKGSGRQKPAHRPRFRPSRRWWGRESTPTPICTPQPTTGFTWPRCMRRKRWPWR